MRSTCQPFSSLLRNRNDENIDDIDLHYDEKNDYTLKKRKEAREAGTAHQMGAYHCLEER